MEGKCTGGEVWIKIRGSAHTTSRTQLRLIPRTEHISNAHAFDLYCVPRHNQTGFTAFSSIFHDVMDLIWLVRHPQRSRNDGNSNDMPQSEHSADIQTTGEIQKSTEYAHTKKISQVVMVSIPAWSQSPPSFDSRAGHAKKSWSQIGDDVIIWRQLRMQSQQLDHTIDRHTYNADV